MNKKIIAGLGIFVLVLATTGATIAAAHYTTTADQHVSFSSFLNWNNGSTLEELIDAYTELDDAKEELKVLMESYGIDVPDLTKEQKHEILRTVREQWRNGKTRDEIRNEVVDLLIGFGVDLPDLSSEQQAEIREKIHTMLESEYGFIFVELTPEQEAYLKQTIIQLKKQGAGREEIKDAIKTFYEGYGGVLPHLTDQEKSDIHSWIHDMIEADYDVDLPDLTDEQRASLKNKKEEVHQLRKDLKEMFRSANRFTKWRFLRYMHIN